MINFLQRHTEEQSHWEKQPERAVPLIQEMKSFFKKKIASIQDGTRAFVKDQIDRSEIVQYFKKDKEIFKTPALTEESLAEIISIESKREEKAAEQPKISEEKRVARSVLNIPKIGSQNLRLEVTKSEVDAIRDSLTPQKLFYDIIELELSINDLIEKYLSEAPSLQEEVKRNVESMRETDGFDDGNPQFRDTDKWILMKHIATMRESRGIPFLQETDDLIKAELKRAKVPTIIINKEAS